MPKPENHIPALPQGVQLVPGNGGFDKLVLDTPDAKAEIYLYGAQVTSWKPAGQAEVLFLSEKSHWAAGKAIRGGIPVCFPWFRDKKRGRPDEPKASAHGFVRTRVWQLDSVAETPLGIRVSLCTASDASTEALWPCQFRLEHHITVGRELTLELITVNTGAEIFHMEEAQHTYYRVGAVEHARVDGLEDAPYLDNRNGNQEEQQTGPVALDRATDNAYQGTEGALTLRAPGLGRRIHIAKAGSQSTVVWNPWADGAAALADLSDDEWQQFLCVEAANIMDCAVHVQPGEQHSLLTRISVG